MWDQAQETEETVEQPKADTIFAVLEARQATDEAAQVRGVEWDVTIIGAKEPAAVVTIGGREYVRSLNGRLYSVDALRESVPQWEAVKVYDNHLTDAEFQDKAGMRSVKNELIGALKEARWDDGLKQLRASLAIVDDALAAKLLAAYDRGVLDTIGLSIDTLPSFGPEVEHEGVLYPTIEGFDKILSVDLVAEPAAGGAFNRVLAAKQTEETMNDEELKAFIAEQVGAAVAASLAAKEAETEEETAEAETEAASVEPEGEAVEPAAQEETEHEEALEAVRRLECSILLRDKLAGLSAQVAGLVRQQYDGKVFEGAEVDTFIKQARAIESVNDPTGRVSGAGAGGRPLSVFDERDLHEVAFLKKVMWDSEFNQLAEPDPVLVADRVPEAYKEWIKAGRPKLGSTYKMSELCYQILGGNPFGSRALEATSTATMTSIVKNSVNVMLANDYSHRQRWWEPIVRTEEVDTIDDATLIRVFGLDNLPVVEEGAAYTETPWDDEEETASVVKNGSYVGVTIEALMRDKVNVIRSIPMRLANAWHNTLSARVSAVFTTNTAAGPVLADTGALFNSTAATSAGGHANLLTAGLTFAAYAAARTAMLKQTDQPLGTGQRLLILPKYVVVPVDLVGAAQAIFGSQMEPGGADNDINPYYNECEVVIDPHATDTNNWALVADPRQWPAIWMIYPRGLRTPAIFEAGDETSGAMFTNDTLRYKVRLMAYRFSSTYDCAPISDWRPLHKSNV
jgi:hypothetical protein